uniref:Uncharacterized protein AlNc14C14G1606 n=1 Tax=Albugo laibachii Nc14 TaxID=890382 RepID=F0W3U1_9STRA|nr:conserved hypothetical protein [Albugo laibachii Nc14]|eukprot:CCA15689.1 conserved hypothetical protein [Albugo laibachii Nc14]
MCQHNHNIRKMSSALAECFKGQYSSALNDTKNRDRNVCIDSSGGFLICLDVPSCTEFGVDYEVSRTGPNFQGVKFIPQGLHLVIFRPREDEYGFRKGFFINFTSPRQVIVKTWIPEDEELCTPSGLVNLQYLEEAARTFQMDGKLGPYPYNHYRTWRRLSTYMTLSVLKRCGIEPNAIILPGDSTPSLRESVCASPSDVNTELPKSPITPSFTRISIRKSGLSGKECTSYYMDRSAMLKEIVEQSFDGNGLELLGELQLSFVIFLQLSSFAAFNQWRDILTLLCSCESALKSHSSLFLAFCKVLYAQLEKIPEDFFTSELTDENFLQVILASFFELLEDNCLDAKLRQHGQQMRTFMAERYQFAFFDSHCIVKTEYDPTVVNLQEEGDEAMEEKFNEDVALAFLHYKSCEAPRVT